MLTRIWHKCRIVWGSIAASMARRGRPISYITTMAHKIVNGTNVRKAN
jgi:hypothetical protein